MVAVAGGGNHKTMIPADGQEVAGGPANTNAKDDHHIAIYFIDSPQQGDDRLILSDKTNGQDYSFQDHLQTPTSPPCYSTDHMLGADQGHYNYNNGSSSSQQQQQQHEHSSRPPRRIKQSRTRRRLAAAVPFVSKIKWGPLWDKSKEWIKNPMNMALFVWIVAVGISGAILFMVMTGMLNAVLWSKAQKDTWFEVNNQILNALFTLMCLFNHPRRFYHLALLCRWRAGDMAALREIYCKGGTVKPNERRHMAVVILLLHLNCLAQYALCGLNLGLPRTRRPPVGVGLTVSVAICAPAVASLYNNLSPLGKDYEVQAADDEESSSSSGSRQLQQKKTVERRYSFSPSPQRQGEMGAVVVAVATEEEDGTSPEWSGGLVADLWEDISLAYLSLFCSCCVFGWNAGRLGFGNAYVHAATFILLCLAPFFIFTLAAINIDDEAARLALSLGGTPEYLRSPNAEDVARLLEMNKARGFPGMLGSIDCMHWSWKNCPKAWHGQFHGQKKGSTIILEAVADQETWIWHAFFEMPGSLNDINVVNRSPPMNKIANDDLPPVQFVANGHTYNYGYYLADDIYPKWQTFVKPLKKPTGKKKIDFHNAQAAARKDVERAFGILQAQFAIVRGPARFWDQKIVWYIMHACVIMHNMIIENERGQNLDYSQYELLGHPVRVRRSAARVARFVASYHAIRRAETHDDLQNDLIEEWWEWNGRQNA